MSSLQDRLNRDPEVVKIEPGESIVGTVLDITTRENEYGSYPLVSLETDDGRELEWHAFHTVAQNELVKVNPQPGDVLGVRNLGKRDGKSYVSYRLVVERNTPAAPLAITVPEDEVHEPRITPLPDVPPAEVVALDTSALKAKPPVGYADEEAF